ALNGQMVAGVEDGDELGLALRGYKPVLKDGISGPIVGAVMIADRIDDRFLARLAGGDASALHMRLVAGTNVLTCASPVGVSAACTVPLAAPNGIATRSVVFDVPLTDVERAQADAERDLWLTS